MSKRIVFLLNLNQRLLSHLVTEVPNIPVYQFHAHLNEMNMFAFPEYKPIIVNSFFFFQIIYNSRKIFNHSENARMIENSENSDLL